MAKRIFFCEFLLDFKERQPFRLVTEPIGSELITETDAIWVAREWLHDSLARCYFITE